MNEEELVTISWPSHPTELAVVESVLQGAGIEYQLQNFHSDHLVGWGAIGGTNRVTRGVEVQVWSADAERAREILETGAPPSEAADEAADEATDDDWDEDEQSAPTDYLSGLLTTTAIVLLLGSFFILRSSRDQAEYFSWEPVWAEVTEVRWDESAGHSVFDYSYRIADREYSRTGSEPYGYKLGNEIAIRVNPADPSVSRSDFIWEDRSYTLRWKGGVCLLASAIFFGLAVHRRSQFSARVSGPLDPSG